MTASTISQPPTPSQPTSEPAQTVLSSKRSPRRILLGVLLLAIIGIFLWRTFFASPALPDSIVAVSGRIEGDDSAVASKTSGRILEVRFREGDMVHAGEVIALLDDAQIRDREDQARAALNAAQAKDAAARAQIGILNQQLMQSQLQLGQSKLDTEGRVKQAEADLAAAQADLARQQAAFDIAAYDKDAYGRLAKTGAVSERQGLQAAATADQEAAALSAAKRRVEAAKAALTTAQGTLSNPDIRQSQVASVRGQIAQQQAEIASAAAQTQQANAQLAEASANRQDLAIRAPFTGTVITRAGEPGEVITAGTAIVTLLDLTKVYLRGFIPEGNIGKLSLGQAARIYLDSAPHTPIEAYVSRIDPQATFTPENTYFRDDRVKQVVGIKLQLKGAFGLAKPGMPSDGEILVKGDSWPKGIHQ